MMGKAMIRRTGGAASIYCVDVVKSGRASRRLHPLCFDCCELFNYFEVPRRQIWIQHVLARGERAKAPGVNGGAQSSCLHQDW